MSLLLPMSWHVLVHYLRYWGMMGSATIALSLFACIRQKQPRSLFFQCYASGNSIETDRLPYRTMWCWRQQRWFSCVSSFRLTGLVFPLWPREGMNPVYSVYVGVFNQILWTFRCSAQLIKDCWDNCCFICRSRTHHDSRHCLMRERRGCLTGGRKWIALPGSPSLLGRASCSVLVF